MPQLADALARSLADDRPDPLPDPLPEPADERDRLLSLLSIYALHLAPLDTPAALRRSERAADPVVAGLKSRLEADWLTDLTGGQPLGAVLDAAGTREQLRAVAAQGRLPDVYRWLARSASRSEVVRFLELEGGPDADFDDLVALCQVGLSGAPKDELAHNYWDEMGAGDAGEVHTVLHREMAGSLRLRVIPDEDLPVEALARRALGGLLATNHYLQPEMVGALGLTELQAGPRCRLVLQALDRLGLPAEARPFYAVHADVDPRHGRDWLDNAVVPLVTERPEWGPRILRGARWRARLNDAFFAWAGVTIPARAAA